MTDVAVQSRHTARSAGLKYVAETEEGIRRVRNGKGFIYKNKSGRVIKDAATLQRIHSLVIPPAWEDVWICPNADGHVQAIGRDARGRKQYRYHPKWRVTSDEKKYRRIIDFAKALPKIRETTSRHLRRHALPREKVLAAVIHLMEKTLIRVGNTEYAKQNNSYGLTTMRDHHVKVKGKHVVFDFHGKHKVHHRISFAEPRLAEIVRKSQDLPGQELFQYVDDDGKVCDIGSNDVNEYIRSITGKDFTAKDFRTWAGTVLAAKALREMEKATSQTAGKRNIKKAIEVVAARLGNTIAVCRKCYVHPAVLDSYLDGTLVKILKRKVEKELDQPKQELDTTEKAVLRLLKGTLKKMQTSA